jgi:hypothetical protein
MKSSHGRAQIKRIKRHLKRSSPSGWPRMLFCEQAKQGDWRVQDATGMFIAGHGPTPLEAWRDARDSARVDKLVQALTQ